MSSISPLTGFLGISCLDVGQSSKPEFDSEVYPYPQITLAAAQVSLSNQSLPRPSHALVRHSCLVTDLLLINPVCSFNNLSTCWAVVLRWLASLIPPLAPTLYDLPPEVREYLCPWTIHWLRCYHRCTIQHLCWQSLLCSQAHSCSFLATWTTWYVLPLQLPPSPA